MQPSKFLFFHAASVEEHPYNHIQHPILTRSLRSTQRPTSQPFRHTSSYSPRPFKKTGYTTPTQSVQVPPISPTKASLPKADHFYRLRCGHVPTIPLSYRMSTGYALTLTLTGLSLVVGAWGPSETVAPLPGVPKPLCRASVSRHYIPQRPMGLTFRLPQRSEISASP